MLSLPPAPLAPLPNLVLLPVPAPGATLAPSPLAFLPDLVLLAVPLPGEGLDKDPGEGHGKDPGEGHGEDPGKGHGKDPSEVLGKDHGEGLVLLLLHLELSCVLKLLPNLVLSLVVLVPGL